MNGVKLVYTYNDVTQAPPRDGMYKVCFKILGLKINYAFGYAEYCQGAWLCPNEDCLVFKWCIEPNPKLLF